MISKFPPASLLSCLFLLGGLFASPSLRAAETPQPPSSAFRTDGGDDKLPWFKLTPGEFPPAGSAHHISGEIFEYDHIDRTASLRPDRTDAQRRGNWDLTLPFVMLPYGSMRYHGAPAELRHFPIGTHLHGQFYSDTKLARENRVKLAAEDKGAADEADFCRCLLLEDDFSYFTRLGKKWRLDAIDWEKMAISVTAVGPGKEEADPKPVSFQIGASTVFWKGRGLGGYDDLKEGQLLLINLTAATLKGPGRCTDIWLDDESRAVATAHQVELHRDFVRIHGLAAWIDAVDNAQGIVTFTLFSGYDPKILEDFPSNAAVAAAAKEPPFIPGPGKIDPMAITAAAAEENLRTWDQINDRKFGPILETIPVEPGPGNSGVRIRFKPSLLIEGFRPKRYIRVWPAKWRVDDLPREERLYK